MMQYPSQFEVIVVGGGHAGVEAALASARLGASTLLVTHNIDTLGQMSCNPAIGGIGKGHLVKEIDALGGIMGRAADQAGIQFRCLNASKGPAVRATRAQSDRALYKTAIRDAVESQENLLIFQQSVDDLIVEDGELKGLITQMGIHILCRKLILTAGTFLGGKIHVGQTQFGGGRFGCVSANALAKRLRALPFTVGRLKTGTPPRILGKSINFSKLEIQPGDENPRPFSFVGTNANLPKQIPCYIARTNENTHKIIRGSLSRSALFSGEISGKGPRYCPSIEDKVTRFSTVTSHQVFVEPEGLSSDEYYPNGLSTSLPFDVQLDYIRSMEGFEKAHLSRAGYAIEYDFFDPRELLPSLETRFVKGLYFAGQINGTTGYEEAASQGIVAGINAAREAKGLSAWHPHRSECYIGVLIDDLITKGTLEPYRMFTSRAEYRLSLREDNADLRLTPKALEWGLIGEKQARIFMAKQEAIQDFESKLRALWLNPHDIDSKDLTISKETRAFDFLKRPEMSMSSLLRIPKLKTLHEILCQQLSSYPQEILEQSLEQVEIRSKYEGYISKQTLEIAKMKKNEQLTIPTDFDYTKVKGLSCEILEKLSHQKPITLGMASRISGVTPAAISLITVYIKRHQQCIKREIETI